MIVVKLMGGLGNQLFQYAVGRMYSIQHNQKLYLDTSDFKKNKHRVLRSFDLKYFKIKAVCISSIEEVKFTFIQRILNKKIKKIIEKKFEYDDEILKNQPPIYLEGYWQSFRYFQPILSELIDEISLKNELSRNAKNLQKKIKERETLAIHFRRGDYVTDSTTNSIHGLCSDEYYLSSIKFFKEMNCALQILIFSDDIDYVKNKFCKYKDFIFVDNINNHTEEFELMKYCNHFVISNSTFSWWAAWLSESKNKKIIAPKNWFKDKLLQSQTNDLIPENWIKM